ncbi:MAG: TlpA family protein disulfide reductase [Rubrivivax sp.]|nr:TlpA family protein disulfide reductase [Rubrivivax sp.]
MTKPNSRRDLLRVLPGLAALRGVRLPAWLPRLALLGAPAATRAAAVPAQPGEPVVWPEVGLIDGERFGPAEVAGRALVVVFFTTSCPFCRRHNRHLQRLHELAPPGLAVLGVARETDVALVRRHGAREGYRFPITLAAEPLAAALSRRRLVPLTVTIGRDGTLRQVIPGEMSEDDVLSLARLAAG